MRRADRLIKIVQFLRSRRLAVTAQTIATEFEICTRTVYRDMQDLMNTGAPITGEAGIGYIIDKSYYLPPITFSTEELEALAAGISIIHEWTDEKFAKTASQAFEKIQAALPTNMQGELEQITTFSMPNFTATPWEVSFSDLREAIRNRQKIHIAYTDGQDAPTKRTARPLGLIYAGHIWLLICWCELRNNFRNFRLDRINSVIYSNETFPNDPTKNIEAFKAQDEICVT